MKERLILEFRNKRYEAIIEKRSNLCKNCCFVDDEYCPEVISKIDCGFMIWKEIKEEESVKQMRINEVVEKVHQNAIDKGWHTEKRSFGELIALCHSELSEALEEYRKGFKENVTYFHNQKPEGIPIELADAVIRIMDMCGLYGIDLEEAIETKMKYNKTRTWKHGGKKI